MRDITVKKIAPQELPHRFFFRLNYVYKTDLSGFTVLYDSKDDVLFVNTDRVPDNDIEDFIRILNYEGKFINDPDSPMEPVVDAVYTKYGFNVFSVLFDGYNERQKKKMDEDAQRQAPEIVRLIKEYMDGEEGRPTLADDEYLLYHIGKIAGKSARKTPYNMVGYETIYAAMYGYMLGRKLLEVGRIKEVI